MTIGEQIAADLREAAAGMIEQAQIERGSRWIMQLQDDHPMVYRIIHAFFQREPQHVMNALCSFWPELREYRTNPLVLRYIEQLQIEMRSKKP